MYPIEKDTPTTAINSKADKAIATRLVAGVFVPDTPLVLSEARVAEIVDAFPRLEMKQRFSRDVCAIVETRPDTTYDNFARDFGERFVPGPSLTAPRIITAESLALATWYDAHPAIRRLWRIRETQRLRVIVSVEPTHDNSDIYPVWIGNSMNWARELRSFTGASVQLELIDEPNSDGIEVDEDSIVVADLYWRDSTFIQPHTMV